MSPTFTLSEEHVVAVLGEVAESWSKLGDRLSEDEQLICALGRNESACRRLAALLSRARP